VPEISTFGQHLDEILEVIKEIANTNYQPPNNFDQN